MSEQWVSSLKVTELRDELTARGLPSKGLKAELAARLLEAVQVSHGESPFHNTPGRVGVLARMAAFHGA